MCVELTGILYQHSCASSFSVGVGAQLWSADHADMIVLRACTSRFRSRFRLSGPTLWNDVPSELKDTDISRTLLSLALRHGFLSVPIC